ncbi:MAG TPA: DNA polymerase III subunit alpha [Candidatus Cryosericum sp.]|nr:DNA polymerase III subunit alpha [Candidatus Cryosericum sp.]
MAEFTHLHVHTQYSLLDGAARIPDLIRRAKSTGQTALAITDHGVMYGVIDFYKACKKEGVKPIIGMETYVAPRSMTDREGTQDREYAHLILLCKNETGYQNLMFLSSEAFLRGFYYRPRIDYDLLSQHAEGLVCLSACLAGDIPQALLTGRYDDALAFAKRLQGMFGEDFYIELQNHGIPEQLQILPGLRQIARDIGAKCVATNDVHYVSPDDAEAQDVLLCIQTQRFVDEPDRMRMEGEQFYLKSAEEMLRALPDDAEALETTAEIVEKCNLEIEFGKRRLPEFTAPDEMPNAAYLRKLTDEGLKKKLPQADDSVRERLEYELGVIEQMGFVDYFLIVWDFIHFAKMRGIMVGPGRGSGAGSLVAYCLDITDVDPLKYNLLFERFLNPERISMPDFDIDFCYERRQEVIDYVAAKYGDGHVSQIITFGTMAARAVIRDVGRVLRVPYADVDRLSKMVPAELNMTLERALSISPELKANYESDEATKKIIDLSLKLEGLPRHSSTHAAGVVISSVPITEVVPLQLNDSVVTTQFTMTTLEELGLLKMDFLGLRTLTVIRDTLSFIGEGGKPVPDLERLPFNDPAVYRMIASGDTDGVFQLESGGMRQFLGQLKPDCFEDLIAGISLYRPGPMEQIPRYVKGKHDPASVVYAHPLLEPILGTTYGCMVYQEQVMEIVRALAGYSYGRSDLVRRAMSKKKHDVMAQEREYFVHGTKGVVGAVKNGVPEQVANRIFDEMMDFASYAFNKSHAAAYAVLAYRTAYLKYYYPVEFLTALINSFLGSFDTVASYVYSARRHGIQVLPPDVNNSRARFSVENGAIRFGLSAVKNVGGAVMEAMVAERTQNGKFTSFFDFCDRVEGLNKRLLEGLISAGCFDSMGGRRAQYLAVFERALDASMAARKARGTGQISLFDLDSAAEARTTIQVPLPDVPELSHQIILAKERESTGLYLSGHPLDNFEAQLKKLPYTVADLMEADGTSGVKDESQVTVGGMLTQCKQKPTRSGTGLMGYAVLEGVTGSVEAVIFPRTLQQIGSLFVDDAPVLVKGKLNIREDRANSLLVEEMQPLNEAGRSVYIKFPTLGDDTMRQACSLLKKYPGKMPVILYDSSKKIAKGVPESYYVDASAVFLAEAGRMFGEDSVKIK